MSHQYRGEGFRGELTPLVRVEYPRQVPAQRLLQCINAGRRSDSRWSGAGKGEGRGWIDGEGPGDTRVVRLGHVIRQDSGGQGSQAGDHPERRLERQGGTPTQHLLQSSVQSDHNTSAEWPSRPIGFKELELSNNTHPIPDQSHINKVRDALSVRPISRASVMIGGGFSRNAQKTRFDARDMPLWNDIAVELFQQPLGWSTPAG